MGSKVALVLLISFCNVIQEGHCVPIDSAHSVSITKEIIHDPIENIVLKNSTNEFVKLNSTEMSNDIKSLSNSTSSLKDGDVGDAVTLAINIDTNGTLRSSRKGRVMNFNFDFPSIQNSKLSKTPPTRLSSKFKSIQSRILTGSGTPLDVLSSNSFQDNTYLSSGSVNRENYAQTVPSMMYVDNPVTNKYDAVLIGQPSVLKSVPPVDRFATFSYANPAFHSGAPSLSMEAPHFHDRFSQNVYPDRRDPVMYQLVPVQPTQQPFRPSFTEAVKDTLFKLKDSVSGTAEKVKNVLGFSGFSEKVASPDALLAVAPVAAGLLAGSLAVAYFASRQGRQNFTSPLNIFGKRSVRDIITEEDLNHIVSRLDPVQREYLQKLQFYGPQRWKDVTCAKYIFCDVMSKATPLHILDMQRKIGIFLSRMDESTARYVEVILKDVMLAIQARDCSRFSCGQSPWGLPRPPPPPPPPLPPQFIGQIPYFGSNFLRRQ